MWAHAALLEKIAYRSQERQLADDHLVVEPWARVAVLSAL